MPRVIDGIPLKELRCKNDNCRWLFGYEKIKSGMLAFECRHCGTLSIFKIRYSKMEENIDMLEERIKERIDTNSKGGEMKNG